MSLALYPARVRSSEVLERTRLGSPKPLKSLGTTSLALRAHPWPRSEGSVRSWCAECRRRRSGATPLTLTVRFGDSAG